ncbi:MAG: exodeoxyribonuclease VII large subunit [Woeseiaceae bacterium]|nr:exodeoxyribonuclease VII large subunit [Woeseiaceae bacterium]
MQTYTVHVTDLLQESPTQRAISVSELNRQAKRLLEDGIAQVWIEGEISNLSRPGSGHIYFSLKDDAAQLRCAWFRGRQRGPAINLKDGDQMLAFGKVSIYETRGEYQLIVEQLEAVGEGVLRRQFEALKKKLATEGLFADDRKLELPELPQKIGIVTSPTGAAVRDIVTVLERRFPAVSATIYPTAVQGEFAPPQIVAAIETAIKRDECDVLIISRGGGSLEDLWSFNDERVARAIANCPIPVVSAVGHEVDFTIADFVADLRAPTPSGAAELVVPDQTEWLQHLSVTSARIATLGRRYLENRFQSLDWLGKRLRQSNPAATVARQRACLNNLQQVMAAAMRHDLTNRQIVVNDTQAKLLQQSPRAHVQQQISGNTVLRQRLQAAGSNAVARLGVRLKVVARALDSVSPLATLDRGYSIVSERASGTLITDATTVNAGDEIKARVSSGYLEATVTRIGKNEET